MNLCRMCNEKRVLDEYCTVCARRIRQDLSLMDAKTVLADMAAMEWKHTGELRDYIEHLEKEGRS